MKHKKVNKNDIAWSDSIYVDNRKMFWNIFAQYIYEIIIFPNLNLTEFILLVFFSILDHFQVIQPLRFREGYPKP